jgi:hypothetical protein
MRRSTASYLWSLGNVFLSLVLGVAALAFCVIFFENFTLEILIGASHLRDWLVSQSASPKMEIIARLVLHESSILLVGFTIARRVVLGALIMAFGWLLSAWSDVGDAHAVAHHSGV